MTIDELKEDYDWKNAFERSRCNIDEVETIIASHDGQNDEEHWEGIFKMKDGKFIFLSAWCDYTGWGCQDGGSFIKKDTLEEVINKFTLGQTTRDFFRDQLKGFRKDWE